jgi:hypothetical protein
MAVVRISNLDGQFTVDKELLGKQDPYVIFELGESKVTTKALKSAGKEAHWTEQYTLENVNETHVRQPLHVAVYNHNTLRPDGLIGQGTLRDIMSQEGHTAKVSLTDKKEKYVGDLTFRLTTSGLKGAGATGATGARTAGAAGLGAGATGATGVAGTRNTNDSSYNQSNTQTHTSHTGAGTGAALGAGAAAGAAAGHHGDHRVSGITGNEFGTGAGTHTGTRGTGMESDREAARERLDNMRLNEGTSTRTTGTHTGTGAGVGGVMGQHNAQHREGIAEEGLTNPRDTKTYREGDNIVTKTTGERNTGVDTRGEACATKYYTVIEDRPVMKEHVTVYKEHHPVEKEFVVETRNTGREREAGPHREEVVDQREKIVDAARPSPCEGAPRI